MSRVRRRPVGWWVLAAVLAIALTPRLALRPWPLAQAARFEPLATKLQRGLVAAGSPPDRAGVVAQSIARHTRITGVDPSLVAAVISIENRELKPRAESHRGARGIMQVMPFWFSKWHRRCGTDPSNIDTNICVGTRVLREHLTQARGSLRRGLLFYNGCRGGEHCIQYPDLVLRKWERVQIAMATR